MSKVRAFVERFFSHPLQRRSRISSRPFYREHPYRGSVSLGSADRRGVIDFDLGFFYNRVPKAGNTTIMSNLAKLKTGEGAPATAGLRSLFPLTPSQLARDEVERFERLYKFTFVRNPYTRVLSAYLDKIAKNEEPGRRMKMKTATVDQPPTFDDFVRWLARDGLHEDIHWAPQSSFLVIPSESFDFIGKLERLDDDFLRVLERLSAGPGATGAVETVAPHSTGAGDRLAAYYTDDLREIVARLYREDFDQFGYER